jgi:hypothetical protein
VHAPLHQQPMGKALNIGSKLSFIEDELEKFVNLVSRVS